MKKLSSLLRIFSFYPYLCIVKPLVLLIFLALGSYAGGANRIFSSRIKSLTSIVNGDWLNRPVMALGTDDKMVVGFDELSHEYHRMTYHLEHCEADWSKSEDIFESDWLQGFNDLQIDDYQNSLNTTVLYTHYQFSIPNDRCRLKMSGNYRLTVFDEDADNEKVLEVEFYVVDPIVSIGMDVTTNTDIDHNQTHQQLSMSINYGNLLVTNTDDELYTVVMQNWREDTARRNVRPNFINNKGLAWEHNSQLIFDGGNEFHKYEILDVSHTTMGLDHIEWDGHYYQAYPFATGMRKNYLTDIDADGAFCIRNSDRSEADFTCDYVMVNYLLQVPYQGEIYLNGHWTTDHDREHYRMVYDEATSSYQASIMQKLGYYSYQYITPEGGIPESEGSFYQTENRYQVLVYYRSQGGRTWHLVGYRAAMFR